MSGSLILLGKVRSAPADSSPRAPGSTAPERPRTRRDRVFEEVFAIDFPVAVLSMTMGGMSAAGESFAYEWLDTTERPGAYMQVASCFYFFDGMSVDEVVQRAPVRDAQPRGALVDPDEPAEFDTAVFEAAKRVDSRV